MKRINDEKDTKIEHYQARNTENELEYTNLLAVCYGNQSSPDSEVKGEKKRLTCDSMKGNQVLHINPQNQEDMATIYYDNSGKIYSTNKEYQDDLQNILNLNDSYGYLIENRKAVIDVVMKELRTARNSQEAKTILVRFKRMVSNWSYGDKYMEYVGVLRWYVDKQLRKHGMS